MSRFETLMSAWTGDEGDLPDNHLEQLREAYSDDLAPYQGKVDTLTNELNELQSAHKQMETMLAKAKSENYDLMMQLPGENSSTEETANDDNSDDGKPLGISGLFENRVN